MALLSEDPAGIVTTLSTGLAAVPLSGLDRSSAGPYDTFSLVDAAGTVTSSAAATNAAGNTRLLFWPSTAQPSLDQQSCDTWSAQTPANGTVNIIQEGVSLRTATTAGVTRSITVLKDVYDYGNSDFFVALWDSQIPKDGFISLGMFDLSAVFGTPGKLVRSPGPSARARSATRSSSRSGHGRRRAGVGDPLYGGTVTIPVADLATWDAPGVPGWYVGHLGAGQSAVFTSLSTSVLP